MTRAARRRQAHTLGPDSRHVKRPARASERSSLVTSPSLLRKASRWTVYPGGPLEGRSRHPSLNHRCSPPSLVTLTIVIMANMRMDAMSIRDSGNEYLVEMATLQNGNYDVSYMVPLKVGTPPQTVYVQVDTGSSDLWLASPSCQTSACKSSGHTYDPSSSSSAQTTSADFSISYLQGQVSGDVVKDTVRIGPASINAQALAAASNVTNEPLGDEFNGVLGLALPDNSLIASKDGGGDAVTKGLFGADGAPGNKFIGMLLGRPGSDRYPSLLGLGTHPSPEQLRLPDGKDVESSLSYLGLSSDESGELLFKVQLAGIDAHPSTVQGPDAGTNQNNLTADTALLGAPLRAVFDSGVPLILTTSTIANAVYGAVGVGPGSDGVYYLPCATPLNLTFTLAESGSNDSPRIAVPLHPSDMVIDGGGGGRGAGTGSCMGAIQAVADLDSSSSNGAGVDIVLGTPFMRNVYSVLAYENPDAWHGQRKRAGPSDWRRDVPTSDWRRGVPTSDFRRGVPTSDFRRGVPVSDFRRGVPVSDFRRDVPTSDWRRGGPSDWRRTEAGERLADWRRGGPSDWRRGGPSDWRRAGDEGDLRLRRRHRRADQHERSSPHPRSSPNLARASSDTPFLGIIPLTDPSWAAVEFEAVNVKGMAYPDPDAADSGDLNAVGAASGDGGGLALGVKIFLGILGFFILCALLLGGRFFYMRRKAQKATPAEKAAEEAKETQRIESWRSSAELIKDKQQFQDINGVRLD
uniref:Peptidase A1 domain-containing protein n=1 Tax=Schizophyllum commune (strain H4-8 / FGSC 9210) TaxID=578458 RepID=D8PYR9_SCHCM